MDESAQVGLLKGLLDQYSPTHQESEATAYLAGQMQALGFAVQIDEEGSVWGSLGSGPREIVLLGHIDTVAGNIPVRIENGRLYGRGAVDAKGPLACFTAAASLAGALPGWRITVVGAVGEEGNSRGAKLVRDRYLTTRVPDYCIIGEPSKWDQVTLGYKGSAWMEYRIQRALAHTAAKTESACDSAFRFWNLVQLEQEQLNAGRLREFEKIAASLRQMSSGDDGFTESAALAFNLRLPPGLTAAQVFETLTQKAGEGSLTLLDAVDCYRAEKNTALVRALLAAIRQAGGKPGFLVKTGTSDMNLVGPAWNCPILAYGPGDSSLDHTPDEHILVSEYLAGIRVLRDALLLLQAGQSSSNL
jgi:LysW-gamma-L-lysine carboxypeptidase